MSFIVALNLVKSLEGGKGNNPADPGGATNCGITQTTWEGLGYSGSVYDATPTQIADCYRKFWDSLRLYNPESRASQSVFELLPEPADSVAFQFHINVPVAPFVRALQGVVGAKMDGHMGPQTWNAINAQRGNGEDLSNSILTAQEWYYRGLRNPQFEHGWLNRVARVREWVKTQA